jgi:hypothetical protein
MWSFYFCSFNEKNVLIGQRCYKIPFHLAQVHILYNLLLLKGHAQTAKHHMSAHFLNQITRENNEIRFGAVTTLTELLFSAVQSQSNSWNCVKELKVKTDVQFRPSNLKSTADIKYHVELLVISYISSHEEFHFIWLLETITSRSICVKTSHMKVRVFYYFSKYTVYLYPFMVGDSC